MMNIWQILYKQVLAIQWLEIVGVISALLFILLAALENKACWPFGLLSSAIYVYLCIEIKLYQDAIINVYYVLMAVYGWWSWGHITKTKNSKLTISWLNYRQRLTYFVTATSITAISGWFFYQFTDASFPFADAFTTVFAFLATWLQARKKIENWILFFIVDTVSAIMYFQKSLYLTSLLFVLYTILCIFAWSRWYQKIKYSA